MATERPEYEHHMSDEHGQVRFAWNSDARPDETHAWPTEDGQEPTPHAWVCGKCAQRVEALPGGAVEAMRAHLVAAHLPAPPAPAEEEQPDR